MQPQGDVTAAEGEAVTLGCRYNSSYPSNYLYWYKQEGNSRPTFILNRLTLDQGTTAETFKERFTSTLDQTSRSLTIPVLTLADTALYYCEGSGIEPTASYQMDSAHSCLITVTVATAANQTLWEESHSPQTHISAKPADDTKHTDPRTVDGGFRLSGVLSPIPSSSIRHYEGQYSSIRGINPPGHGQMDTPSLTFMDKGSC
uniref:Ig-like domain-containing protein n=1 Tax=Sphaeramia orbicularis TaxID=375764 RepID=A0A673BZ11_9TELE